MVLTSFWGRCRGLDNSPLVIATLICIYINWSTIVQINNFVNFISSLRTTTSGHICYMCFPLSYKLSTGVSSVYVLKRTS